MIRADSPLLLVVALVAAAVVALRLRGLPPDLRGSRRRGVQGLMMASTLAAGLALSGLEVTSRSDRLAVVFVVDRSRSVERASRSDATRVMASVREAAAAMGPDDQAGLVVFAAEAATEVAPSPRPSLGAVTAAIARDQTDIAAGIERGLAELPGRAAGRLVLISDGVATRGDTLRAATVAAGRGVEIDVVPIDRPAEPEVALEQVDLPDVASPAEPVRIRLVTRSTGEAAVRVRVRRDGAPLARADTRIAAGQDVLTLTDVPPVPGLHRYDVSLEPADPGADSAPENNAGSAVLMVSRETTALVAAGVPDDARPLADAIEGAGIETVLAGPDEVPTDLESLSRYDLVVLSDLDASSLSEGQLAALAAQVELLGGGLLMVGARHSFGLGGYAYTPVEEVLPASFEIRRRRDRPSLAMLIAIDRSGSMSEEVSAGRNKLDLANEAAARSARLLAPIDRVGVMHVDTEVTWTVPLTDVVDPEPLARRIYETAVGGGGILVDLTLTEAYRALRSDRSQLRHLLLFADGADAEEMGGARALVQAANAEGVTTSVISMGRGQDTAELEVLSRLGQGRFFIVDDLRALPRVFSQETIEASRSALVEEPFRPVVAADDEVVRALDLGAAPDLLGYAIVTRRPRAAVLLAATDDDPLLLAWQRGLGRSAVFATDCGSRYGRPWLAWSGYRTLFGQLARSLARPPARRDMSIRATVDRGVGRVRVQALDDRGRARNYLDLAAQVVTPAGGRIEVPLAQTGAAVYEGTFDASVPGPYLAAVREATLGTVGNASVVAQVGDELRGEGTDRAVLGQIASLTGGRVRRDLDGVFADRPPPTLGASPLWQPLVAAALIMVLLSVALRRLVVPRGLVERITRLRSGAARAAPGGRAQAVQATLAALTAARSRARKGEARTAAGRAAAAPGDARIEAAASRARRTRAAPSREAAPAEPPGAPASLAEKLLERKRKKG
jgi:uncharacterized membrane protein